MKKHKPEFEPFTHRLQQLKKDRADIPLTDDEFQDVRASILEDLAVSKRIFCWKDCLQFPAALGVILLFGGMTYAALSHYVGNTLKLLVVSMLAGLSVWVGGVLWVKKDPLGAKPTREVRIEEVEKIREKNLITKEEYDQLRSRILTSDETQIP